jgi:hypothetical protein
MIHKVHLFEDGDLKDTSDDTGDPTGYWYVRCSDCGLQKRYSPKKRPKWLQVRVNQIVDRDDEE